jgi:acetolactate synthase-1/2/3 large subunit
LDTDGPSVISVECSADEIPPFANFLGNAAVSQPLIVKENDSNVAART